MKEADLGMNLTHSPTELGVGPHRPIDLQDLRHNGPCLNRQTLSLYALADGAGLRVTRCFQERTDGCGEDRTTSTRAEEPTSSNITVAGPPVRQPDRHIQCD
jgi:hypothetical protein